MARYTDASLDVIAAEERQRGLFRLPLTPEQERFRSYLRDERSRYRSELDRTGRDLAVLDDALVNPGAPPEAATQVVLRATYTPTLRAEIAAAQSARAEPDKTIAELEAREAELVAKRQKLSDVDQAALDAARKQSALQAAKIKAANADLDLLDSGVLDRQKIQQLAARRGIGVPEATATTPTGAALLDGTGMRGGKVSDKGDYSAASGTSESRAFVRPNGTVGYAQTDATRTTSLGVSGYSVSDKNVQTRSSGANTVKHTTGTTTAYTPASLGREVTTTDKREKAVAGGDSSSSEHTDTTKVGLASGYQQVSRDVVKKGDELTDTSSTRGVKMTADGLAYGSSRETKVGKEKPSTDGSPEGTGELQSGTTTKSDTAITAIMDPTKGVGLGATNTTSEEKKSWAPDSDPKTTQGKREADAGRTGGMSTTTRKEVAFGGKVLVNVSEWKNPDPDAAPDAGTKRYEVTLTIAVSGGLTVSSTSERSQASGESGSASIEGKATAARSVTFGHVLSAEDAQVYSDAVKAGGKDARPSWPELRILARAPSIGWGGVGRELLALKGGAGAALPTKEGDRIQVTDDSSLGLKGSLEGKSGGGIGLGGSLGFSSSTQVDVQSAMLSGDRILVRVSVKEASDTSGSLSVSSGLVNGGVSGSEGKSRTRIVGMIFPATAAGELEAIRNARTVGALDAIAARYRAALRESGDIEGATSERGVKFGVFGVTLNLAGKGEFEGGKTTTYDKSGKASDSWKYAGSYTGGGNITAGSAPAMGSGRTSSYTGEVDSTGAAKSRIDEQDKTFSATKTAKAFGTAISKGEVGAVVNPAAYVKQNVDSRGLEGGDPELESIITTASDPVAWSSRVASPRLRPAWLAAGTRIAALGQQKLVDGRRTPEVKAAVQRELALISKEDDGYKAAIQGTVRPAGTEEGGIGYAFPEGTESLSDSYKTLVVANPVQAARASVGQGKLADAETALKKVDSDLGALDAALRGFAGKFKETGDTGAYTEMLGRIGGRRQEAVNELRRVRAMMAKAPAAAVAGSPVPTTPAGPTAEQLEAAKAVEKENDLATIRANIKQMVARRDEAQSQIGQAESLYREHGLSNTIKGAEGLQKARATLNGWETLYWKTFGLVDKYKEEAGLRSEVEANHPAGTWGYLNKVRAM